VIREGKNDGTVSLVMKLKTSTLLGSLPPIKDTSGGYEFDRWDSIFTRLLHGPAFLGVFIVYGKI
jgi:hypothetical protein